MEALCSCCHSLPPNNVNVMVPKPLPQEREKLKRNVQAVLNKLTFQKFKILLAQLKMLNIDSEEAIGLLVDLIYENSVYEPYFCILYANLCKHLASKKPFFNQSDEHADFRTLLLTKCLKSFEEKYENSNESDIAQIQDNEEKKKLKTRWIANIRFMGELYKFSVIPISVILNCIEIFLKHEDEDSLECFCWLMRIAGKELETSKDHQEKCTVERYFAHIQKIVDSRLTSIRIRFMLQDIIDLRKNDWIPRRIENIPKTVDEIRREAAFEAQKQMLMYRRVTCNEESLDDKQENITCHNHCVCEAEESKSSGCANFNFSAFSESKSETISEVKNLLLARSQKGKKKLTKTNTYPKQNSTHVKPENKHGNSEKDPKSEA
ncbi:eukaryotic translation initiation factor 4 gamma 3 [Caerostris extrusa]|uniref:Eukaryotic translation initiation factor 4 gamma 3 n=1 Tax=Caerostris extrusa TaxID=172846 RepID=A0AAV4Y328_CAEEX|nr:eukaryotic translation initiation factor 4 gamma 3 [Caerostris extrusa]